MSEEDDIVVACCKKLSMNKLKSYTINDDKTVVVDGGDVTICHNSIKSLPLKFNKVIDSFNCSCNKLISLEGCPDYVGANFCCASNNLTTLEGCPKYVGGGFNCVYNRLTTLQHLPVNFHIGEYFLCDGNRIDNPGKFGKLFFGYIGGTINTGHHKQLNEFLNKNKNPPKKDLPKLLSELRKITL